MLAKACFLVVAIGASACILLTIRQQRLDAAHDVVVVQRRMMDLDRDFLRLRSEIAARLLPGRIEALASRLGPLVPIGVDPARPVTALAAAMAPAIQPARRPAR